LLKQTNIVPGPLPSYFLRFIRLSYRIFKNINL
jgi:hypothetical protein